MKILGTFLVLCICQNGITSVGGSKAAEKDLTLTTTEKQALDKFKKVMYPALNSPHFRKEVYLIRWLRATGFDVKRAERMLLENLEWRNEFKMDKIHTEDWAEFDQEFPYYKDSVDKEFQPFITSHMGDWDFRKVILNGKRNKMARYIFKLLDDVEIGIQKQQERGKLVTRGSIIVDVEGYNLVQHFCAQCISLYLEMLRVMENNYPGLFDKMIIVNVPSSFETLLNIMKQAMNPETKNSLQVFGSSRRKWQNYLLDRIDEDALPLEFGGNYIHSFNNEF